MTRMRAWTLGMAALLWATGCGSGTTAPASSATDGSGETEGVAADASEPKGARAARAARLPITAVEGELHASSGLARLAINIASP